jgi:transcriptional regulator with XRE-family HTH domain
MNDFENELDKIRFILSENLKINRRKCGISQEKLAYLALVDRTLVSRIERKIANPSLEALLRLSKALDIPIADLLVTLK